MVDCSKAGAVYRAIERRVDYLWPEKSLCQHIDPFELCEHDYGDLLQMKVKRGRFLALSASSLLRTKSTAIERKADSPLTLRNRRE